MIYHVVAPILLFLSIQVNIPGINFVEPKPLALKEISLENRYNDLYVNSIFKDNILLNIAYMRGEVTKSSDIVWEEVRKPFQYKFALESGKTFAFHEDVLPEYYDSVTVTTKAHFNFLEGFKFSGYVFGDGVCHLASLMYLVAKEAGLDAYAATNHDFAKIPEIPKEYGVSIYSMPGQRDQNARQNLYITNNKKEPVVFEFEYNGKNLKLSITK